MTKISKALKTWNKYFYKCKCGAEDSNICLGTNSPTPVLNCWKCHSGQGKEMGQVLMEGIGMVLVSKEPESWGESWVGT